jgi:hypothetical protein
MLARSSFSLLPAAALARPVVAALLAGGLVVLGGLGGAPLDAADDPSANAAPPANAGAAPAPAPPAEATATAPPATAPTAASPTAPALPLTRPRIEAEKLEQDAGRVRKGKRVELEFVLANRGDAPLQIKDVQPSCGCTVASFDKQIAPGATGGIRASLDTTSFDGPIAKHLTVLSNDPDTPRLVLTIRADVQAFLRASPSYVRILQVQSQEPEKAGINLWATDGRALEIRKVETPFDWVVASVRRPTDAERDADASDNQWRLEVSVTDAAPLGPLRDKIRIETDHPDEPVLEIPLSGNVRRVLHLQPGEVDFGKVAQPVRNPKKVGVKLFNFGKEPVEVRSAESDLPFVTAAISPEEPGRRFRVDLLLAADAPKGKFEGRVRVETSSTLLPTLEIPVRGKVD